jgi:hypothetical protein
MTDGDPFKYDVALSFHSKDEQLATNLNDKVQDRFNTFIYSEHQKTLAGRDGEDAFSKVFGEEARLVVIFFRNEWGETPFTRIEKDAIRNRAFNAGYDFTLFIPTDPTAKLPPWLPRSRLYFGLDRFGLDGAAAVIESKIEELGGEPKIESVADRANRLERSLKFASQRKAFIESYEGVNEFKKQIELMFSAIVAHAERIKSDAMRLTAQEVHGYKVVYGMKPFLLIHRQGTYANSLDGSKLVATYYDSAPDLPGFMPGFERANPLKTLNYTFDLSPTGEPRFSDQAGRFFSAEDLAEYLLTEYLNTAELMKGRR